MKLIYVAGPLTPRQTGSAVEYLLNMRRMILTAVNNLIPNGFAVYVPGLDFLFPILSDGITEKMLRENSLEILRRCDAVLVLGLSPGVEAEIAEAEKFNIPVIKDYLEGNFNASKYTKKLKDLDFED